MFKVYATTPETMNPADIIAHARRAEAMGYDGLNVPDAVHDGFLLSAMALNATTTLKVGTGVLVAFPRSPMQVAVAAWDLQQLSNGRFELGLGTQVKGNIEKRYSTKWTAPVPRMREYIGSLRAIFDSFQNGTKLNFIGEHYQFTKLQPFFNPGPIEHPQLPIYMGAVGPLMTALAGEVSDGMITHPTNTPPRYMREVALPRLQKGADKAGRSLADVNIILSALVATGKDDATVAAEKEKQRNLLGFLYSTPSYWPSLELFGWQHKGEQLLQMTREGNWQDMPAIIDDDMLEQFVPIGRYDEIVGIMQQRYSGLSTMINFPLPDDPADDVLAEKAIAALKA
ncbi:TIGR03617 family F420-dependent LLM class oxidoreductase [Oceanicoccus sp. KOV_DT_Chl]|uniref:TIGR03617 family F420-dependent LLM class oxidoreductase n=1 Tax=Oceanicoccus sp. KOV_DT_Chl TaxID=1904639 RepID=UPI000C7AF85E|nr:TIGR03617 family F420-dependent LLM class oxidoreductase [Oceanicoccus sp. KOV_DT_Chl]